MARKKFKLEIVIEAKRVDKAEPMRLPEELIHRIEDLIAQEYMEDGEDLMGYEGPMVTKVTGSASTL